MNMNTISSMIEDVDEYEIFEEEVISYYDTGLSTIVEGENESCTSTSRKTDLPLGSTSESSLIQSPTKRNVPQQINLTPTRADEDDDYNTISTVTPSADIFALVSPMMFSPMAEARKLRSISSAHFRSPLHKRGLKAKVSPSPSSANRKKKPTKSISTSTGAVSTTKTSGCGSSGSTSSSNSKEVGMPLVLTNLETGEELYMNGDEDDDEFTFVSCDTESMIDAPPLFDGDSQNSFSSLSPVRKQPSPIEYQNKKKISLTATSTSQQRPRKQHNQPFEANVIAESPRPSSSTSSLPSLSLEQSGSTSIDRSNDPLDFEATKQRLEDALNRRIQQGKIPLERMDYMRRRLRYNLQRKMIQERLHQCLIPSATTTSSSIPSKK